jgi:23S rRNA pseudouridine1911/1915/1917 synthase
VTGDRRLDVAVHALMPSLSRSRAAALIREGAVRVDGEQVRRPAARIPDGAAIDVDVPPPVPAEAAPEDLPIHVVYEDDALIVIDKVAGMVVHPSAGHGSGTLVNALLHHVSDLSGVGGVQRPGIVHRLDRGTTGLLVVAKTDLAHRSLSEQFASHAAGRRYLALCFGMPANESGTVRSRLARHPRDRMRWASTSGGGAQGREAITHWRVQGRADPISLIACRLETGRTHQVRVHLSEQGWPIIGDPLYGRRSSRLPAVLQAFVDPERPLLHAAELSLVHPGDGRPMTFTAPIPADFRAALVAVGLAQV